MSERVVNLTAGEVAAMAEKVIELEDYCYELRRDGQIRIDEISGQLDQARCEAARWRRMHDGARGALWLAAVIASCGWVLAVWG